MTAPRRRPRGRLTGLADLLAFLRQRKSARLYLLVAILLLLGGLAYLTQVAALSPFLYPLF